MGIDPVTQIILDSKLNVEEITPVCELGNWLIRTLLELITITIIGPHLYNCKSTILYLCLYGQYHLQLDG